MTWSSKCDQSDAWAGQKGGRTTIACIQIRNELGTKPKKNIKKNIIHGGFKTAIRFLRFLHSISAKLSARQIPVGHSRARRRPCCRVDADSPLEADHRCKCKRSCCCLPWNSILMLKKSSPLDISICHSRMQWKQVWCWQQLNGPKYLLLLPAIEQSKRFARNRFTVLPSLHDSSLPASYTWRGRKTNPVTRPVTRHLQFYRILILRVIIMKVVTFV